MGDIEIKIILDEEKFAELYEMAKDADISVSELIAVIISRYLDENGSSGDEEEEEEEEDTDEIPRDENEFE